MQAPDKKRIHAIVIRSSLITVLMFGFGFALVPLYDVFCDLTGLNGKVSLTPIHPVSTPGEVPDVRQIQMQFIAINNETLPWEFAPREFSLPIQLGKPYVTHYRAKNLSSRSMTVQAIPSVSPGLAAQHLSKMECFCFEQQRLEAGEEMDMAVRFVVSPSLPQSFSVMTLSYTLFDVSDKNTTQLTRN